MTTPSRLLIGAAAPAVHGLELVEVLSSQRMPLRAATTTKWSQAPVQYVVRLGRQFTEQRLMAPSAIAVFKEGLWPLLRARKLAALLLRFPADFAFQRANRDHVLALRRAFHEFPLVLEAPHESWLEDEAQAVLIDHRIAFANSCGTSRLTNGLGFIRVNDRGALDQIRRVSRFADRTLVIAQTPELACDLKDEMWGAQPRLDFERAVA